MTAGERTSYRAAGVDVVAGDRAVTLMRGHVARATRPEVVGSLGGFAGLFALDTSRYRQPLLASSTDGVGTKIAIARALDIHDTVGIDLVAMVVDDLVVCGAEPLFLLDYIACGSLVPERIAQIVAGIATGCEQAGAALVGGETAEHPGLMGSDDYDLAATGVGVVEADAVLGPERVRPGDVVVAMASSGLHSNGFSLVRHILCGPVDSDRPGGVSAAAAAGLRSYVPSLGEPLGSALLAPTRIYAKDCLALAAAVEVHAFAHITGGGLAANTARVIPAGLVATMDRATWSVPPIFALLAERGEVAQPDMENTFNQGVGMVAVLAPEAAGDALALLAERGVPAWLIGSIGEGGSIGEAGSIGGAGSTGEDASAAGNGSGGGTARKAAGEGRASAGARLIGQHPA
ncbi:phosphoribosylformylglycinamidine cyclo-ligase [Frankia sp. AgKG'84/4]|uniref:phosphoribosylformylglycinamidine cyclo-ligase n=1 Tax=Frankia sp. AgKG'84/4 TaxID=573490 RepID=UPI002010956C|nr:phosphoribosylformylglycinamidine cyclo-ligase [Frankia sp. AgKG'84/4]MCL9796160.1 phosphoribosylformylglycinamidine cyclo-ligase [Frankia sp. AgKG'84/4]